MAKKKYKEKKQNIVAKPRPHKKFPVSEKLLAGIILGFTFLCLIPLLNNGFLNFDDPQYVTENPAVQKLDAENFKKMFTMPFVGNYQPVVMLAYAFEYKFFQLKAGGFHFFSLLLHLLNTAMVFYLVRKLLKNPLAAGVAALLFGIHPLHVESVAWIASQKDVLYSCFFLASSLFYLDYLKVNSRNYFILALLFFILSLLCKAQAVVLPVVFLLYDFLLGRKLSGKVWLEKIPFFILSLIFGVLAVYMQKKAGAVQDFGYFPFYERILFACYGFVNYLIQTLVPLKLAIFYPYPETEGKINSVFVYLAPFVILVLAILVFRYRKHSRVLVFGALFFCITIALVIQVIPVGDAVHADRYSYISLIGLFTVAGHIFAKYYERASQKNMLAGIVSIYFILMGILAFNRSKVFKDNLTAYSNSLENYPASIIYSNRGAELYKMGRYQEALNDFIEARKLKPRFPNIWFNSGMAAQMAGKIPDALHDYTEALKYNDKDINVYIQRANIYKSQNNFDGAINDFTKVIELNPGVIDAWYGRGESYGRKSMAKEAVADFDKVISMKPDYIEAYTNRGIANTLAGNYDAALRDYGHVLQFRPQSWHTYFNRSLSYKAQGRYADALNDALTAKNNGYPVAESYLAELHKLAGR